VLRRSTESDTDADVLLRVVEGTAGATGERFFESLVRNLSLAMGVAFAFVAEFAGASRDRVRTRALWGRGARLDDVEYDLAGTPCAEVVAGSFCHHARGLQRRFPADTMLVDLGVESYVGVPLRDADGGVLGHLAVMHTAPMEEDARALAIFQIFAARAAAELERLQAEQRLRDSERRFRDLYEEAPIAYVYEDTETRFVSANRRRVQLVDREVAEDVADAPGVDVLLLNQRHRLGEVPDAERALVVGKLDHRHDLIFAATRRGAADVDNRVASQGRNLGRQRAHGAAKRGDLGTGLHPHHRAGAEAKQRGADQPGAGSGALVRPMGQGPRPRRSAEF